VHLPVASGRIEIAMVQGIGMSLLNTEPQIKTRTLPADLNDAIIVTGVDVMNDAALYLDGDTHRMLTEMMAKRYCTRIVKAEGGDDEVLDDGTSSVYYADPILAAEAAVRSGQFEVVDTGIYCKLVHENATLANNTAFEYTDENDNAVDAFAADITEAREQAGFSIRLARLDELSVAAGSAAMLVQILGGSYDYQPMLCTALRVVFNKQIVDGDTPRPVNTLSIDDASLVVVQLGGKEHVAYYGRSEQYPQGRMVKYTSANWKDIPGVGQTTATDTLDDAGQPVNPLTRLQDVSGDYSAPEYPIVVWNGTTRKIGTTLMPCDVVAYKNAMEADLATSRILTSSLKAASGMTVFSADAGASPVMPENIGEGLVALKPGQALNVISVPAINSKYAGEFIGDLNAMISESAGVPSYRLGMSKMTLIPSGVALQELDKPAQKHRQWRADINRANMQRLFAIECCLARIENDDPSVGVGVYQTWTVRDFEYASNPVETMTAEKLAQEIKIGGRHEAARKYNPALKDATRNQIDAYLQELDIPEAPSGPSLGRFAALT
jgi:hypothetical protein